MSSETTVVRHLIGAYRELNATEEALRPDTEYLRDEVKEVRVLLLELFEKIKTEHMLFDLQSLLHDAEPEVLVVQDPLPGGTTSRS